MDDGTFGFERDIHTTIANPVDIIDILEAAEARSTFTDADKKAYEDEIEKQKRITVVALRLIQQKLEEQLTEINQLKEENSSLKEEAQKLRTQLEALDGVLEE